MLDGRDWHKSNGATAGAIKALKACAPVQLPEAYYDLLTYSDGGAGPLPVQPFYVCLDAAHYVAETERLGTFKEFFPDLFVIGSNGGGEGIAFDIRGEAPFAIVYFDMNNCDLAESIVCLSPSFEAFLAIIGLEETL